MTQNEMKLSEGQYKLIRVLEREKGQKCDGINDLTKSEASAVIDAYRELPNANQNPALQPKEIKENLIITTTPKAQVNKKEYAPAKIGMAEKIILEQGNYKYYIDHPKEYQQEVLFLLQLFDKVEEVLQ